MPSNHLSLCHHLILLSSIFPIIRVFSSESALHIRWPKYWSFSLSISPYSEYTGLISFRIDWFDFLSVQGTLKSLLQHHSSKHQFFSAQLSFLFNSHIHIWLLGLTRWTFVGKIMYLLFICCLGLSYCSWGSQGKNTEVACHSLLQWTTFCQTFHHDPTGLGGSTWHGLVSLS